MKRLIVSGMFVLAGAGSAFAGETTTYEYDVRGRLVAVEHASGPADGVTTEYQYDDAGNRTQKKKTGA